jgi:hypothetical protein
MLLTQTKVVTWLVEVSGTPPFATTPLTTVHIMPPQLRPAADATEDADVTEEVEATEAAPELLPELPELLEELLAGVVPAGVTWIEKAGISVVVVPSLAVMTILLYWPGALGVPESAPLVSAKVAQSGLFWMPKVRAVPLGLATVGTKL